MQQFWRQKVHAMKAVCSQLKFKCHCAIPLSRQRRASLLPCTPRAFVSTTWLLMSFCVHHHRFHSRCYVLVVWLCMHSYTSFISAIYFAHPTQLPPQHRRPRPNLPRCPQHVPPPSPQSSQPLKPCACPPKAPGAPPPTSALCCSPCSCCCQTLTPTIL
jgi:hypothetical protein